MIDIIRLLLEFGVSLILLFVIVVIMPCFYAIHGEPLKMLTLELHDKIILFLAPLYIVHLCVIGLQLLFQRNPYTIGSTTINATNWISGLGFLAPLLRKLTLSDEDAKQNGSKLVFLGNFRIALQLILFIWSALYLLQKYNIMVII